MNETYTQDELDELNSTLAVWFGTAEFIGTGQFQNRSERMSKPDGTPSEVVILGRNTYRETEEAPAQERIASLLVVNESLDLHLVETIAGKEAGRIVLDPVEGYALLEALKKIYKED